MTYKWALLAALDTGISWNANLEIQVEKLLEKPLRSAYGSRPSTLVVVIDALDELDDENATKDLLRRLVAVSGIFVLISRLQISDVFSGFMISRPILSQLIGPSMLMQKPIDLRHICLFYLSHIPTFLDIHLSRLLQEPNTEPDAFKYIFERGIDPDLEDRTVCHPHPEVPQKDEDWPSPLSILQFQAHVRARILKLYEDIDAGTRPMTRQVGRVLFMTFEHEAMHVETLLYKLLQRAGTGTIPPPGFTPPSWESLAETWNSASEPDSESSAVTLGPTTITLGHDDNEADDALAGDVAGHEFGWDNEHHQEKHPMVIRLD
ncbi:DUF323 domain-containing protein [Mycena venus]|uniref:DUF323 domain-containing protein n=1 Tax=Mycena venus TaxID=2733690 RepID=A0A8H6XX02_9AGAR|nr:DUF323 domain-containing protein [Mycena venus]